MGRIIRRIQDNAIEGGYYKPRRVKVGLASMANDEAVKEERRLADDHRQATQVQTRGRRSKGVLGALSRLFRRRTP